MALVFGVMAILVGCGLIQLAEQKSPYKNNKDFDEQTRPAFEYVGNSADSTATRTLESHGNTQLMQVTSSNGQSGLQQAQNKVDTEKQTIAADLDPLKYDLLLRRLMEQLVLQAPFISEEDVLEESLIANIELAHVQEKSTIPDGTLQEQQKAAQQIDNDERQSTSEESLEEESLPEVSLNSKRGSQNLTQAHEIPIPINIAEQHYISHDLDMLSKPIISQLLKTDNAREPIKPEIGTQVAEIGINNAHNRKEQPPLEAFAEQLLDSKTLTTQLDYLQKNAYEIKNFIDILERNLTAFEVDAIDAKANKYLGSTLEQWRNTKASAAGGNNNIQKASEPIGNVEATHQLMSFSQTEKTKNAEVEHKNDLNFLGALVQEEVSVSIRCFTHTTTDDDNADREIENPSEAIKIANNDNSNKDRNEGGHTNDSPHTQPNYSKEVAKLEDEENDVSGDKYNGMDTIDTASIAMKLADILKKDNGKAHAIQKASDNTASEKTTVDADVSDDESDESDKIMLNWSGDDGLAYAEIEEHGGQMKGDKRATFTRTKDGKHTSALMPNRTSVAAVRHAASVAEITRTNWWHTLPYAEIRRFVNAIWNGAGHELYAETVRKSKEIPSGQTEVNSISERGADRKGMVDGIEPF